jgi:hypothetical protein
MRGFEHIIGIAPDEPSDREKGFSDGCGSGGCSSGKKNPSRGCGCKSGCGKEKNRLGMDTFVGL